MEKQQPMSSCDSMTTVTMKDYNTEMGYPEPPPSYKTSGLKSSQLVQVTKILAITAVTVSAMISFSIVLSAWLNSTNAQVCQYQQQPSIESILQPQSLRSQLTGSKDDLDLAESKLQSKKNAKDRKLSASSEEDNDSDEEDAVTTMLKLPLELNLHEHLFEKNHRSQMSCVVEKKKAEEIVDEQSKTLPPFLGINITTDPRYLHFSGEKMAISCNSGNNNHNPPPFMEMYGPPPPPPHISQPFHHFVPPQQTAFGRIIPHPFVPLEPSNLPPVQIIGPIPLGPFSRENRIRRPAAGENSKMIPILVSENGLSLDELSPVLVPSSSQEKSSEEASSQFHIPRPIAEIQFGEPSIPDQKLNSRQIPLIVQPSEIRERALHNPVPIFPRPYTQHIIRPRSVKEVDKNEGNRFKRCACDCSCKNHKD